MEARSDWAHTSRAVSSSTERTMSPNFIQPPQNWRTRGGSSAEKESRHCLKLYDQGKRIGTDLHSTRPSGHLCDHSAFGPLSAVTIALGYASHEEVRANTERSHMF